MTELLCVGGKADGTWTEVDLQRREVGDHWSVAIIPPMVQFEWNVPPEPVIATAEVYRIECWNIRDPRGSSYPPRKIHFLVKGGVDLFDAMVLLFRNYKPEDPTRAQPDQAAPHHVAGRPRPV